MPKKKIETSAVVCLTVAVNVCLLFVVCLVCVDCRLSSVCCYVLLLLFAMCSLCGLCYVLLFVVGCFSLPVVCDSLFVLSLLGVSSLSHCCCLLFVVVRCLLPECCVLSVF